MHFKYQNVFILQINGGKQLSLSRGFRPLVAAIPFRSEPRETGPRQSRTFLKIKIELEKEFYFLDSPAISHHQRALG